MEKSIYSFIWRYSKRQQIIVTLITAASFPFLYAALQLPKVIVNDALSGTDFPRDYFGTEFDQTSYLLTLCAILLALLLINALFLMSVNTYKNLTSERMTRRLRYMLYQRILRFPLPHFQRVSQGELSTMIAGEVELIRDFFADAIALPIYQGGTLMVILVFMFVQDPLLGAASIALIPLQAYVIPKLQRKINLLNKDRIARARKLSGRVGESVSGIRDIRANNTTQYAQADFSKHLGGIFKVRYVLFKTKYFMKALNVFLLKLTPLLFYSVGGLLILNGRLSVGALVAALAAYSNLTTPWKELLKYYQRKGDAGIKYEQLVANFELSTLLNEKHLMVDESEQERLNGSLAFANVTIVDDDNSKSLDGVSFEIASGGRLAIVAGAVGREKLAYAITRLISPSEGQITIGGRELKTYSEKTLGSRIGYAGSETYVFEGTVGYNTIFSLQHQLPEGPAEDSGYDLEEAHASGNCPYDAEQDWTDYKIAHCMNEDELQEWWIRVIHAVELEDLMFNRALGSTIDPQEFPELAEQIVKARKLIVGCLERYPELGGMVHGFDIEAYNPSASVAANLIFGEPVDDRFAIGMFGENEIVRQTLKKAGIDDRFIEIGLEVSRQMVDLFGDQQVDQALLERFNFIDPNTLEKLTKIIAKVDGSDLETLSDVEKSALVSVTGHIVLERHRLVEIDETLQTQIVAARKLFHEILPEDQVDAIEPYDSDAVNSRLSIRANLIMGRITQQRANAEEKVHELIRGILSELDVFRDVLLLSRNVEVGIGGQRLPTAARQSVVLARALMKRPDIVLVNDALNAHDREGRDRILHNILELLTETTFVWIDSEMPNAKDFDEVLVLRNGRIDKRIVEAEEQEIAAPAVVAEEETPQELQAEAAALARVPIFREIRSGNLKLLALGSKRVAFHAGEVLFNRGDPGETAYVILSGEVDILLNMGTDKEKQIARSGKDQPVGEIALLATVPRTAAARAFSDVTALQIDKEAFIQIV
ncbi:MAG: ABC transporter transmembrane domain-containing protein, partial [Hyphomicrobiales bacterium]|nr:ABC transporter transmembrane domain-containing protein [Hyphomicrobiales bacterium]